MSTMQATTAAATPRPLGVHGIHLAVFAMVIACSTFTLCTIHCLIWHLVMLPIRLDSTNYAANLGQYPQRNLLLSVSNPLD